MTSSLMLVIVYEGDVCHDDHVKCCYDIVS